MTELAADLPALLALERIDENLFRARNADLGGRPALYGGQVAAQALMAAAATVEPDRVPHSFHGYFLRAGRPETPVILHVDRDRDGRSFSARRVVAVQNGKVIFSMLASFHHETDAAMYDAAPQRAVEHRDDKPFTAWATLLEVSEVTRTDLGAGQFTDCLWVRSASPLGDDPVVHRAALACISDLGSGFGQLREEGIGFGGPSVDHSMWFHEPIRSDEWVLVDLQPIKARSARGVYHGSLRNGDGVLGATITQEMLLLPKERVLRDPARSD